MMEMTILKAETINGGNRTTGIETIQLR